MDYIKGKLNTRSILIVVSLLVAVGIVVSSINATAVPDSFENSRASASKVSENIVRLTGLTGSHIASINFSDLQGDRAKALRVIEDARASNKSAYDEAFILSQHLKEMTLSLSELPRRSQGFAYEAVAIELSLVAEFISYTESLNIFLDKLSFAVSSRTTAARAEAQDSLKKVNERVSKINVLNSEFQEKMRLFDESL